MEENNIPEHVVNQFLNKNSSYPNIVRTRNITLDGINVLIEKNNLEWTNSIYDKGYIYIEGLVVWGKSKTFIYFKKITTLIKNNILYLGRGRSRLRYCTKPCTSWTKYL